MLSACGGRGRSRGEAEADDPRKARSASSARASHTRPDPQRPRGARRRARRASARPPRPSAAATASARATKREKGTGPTPPAERDAGAAKVRQGTVVSDKADKTITVRIDVARRHPTYEKIVRRSGTLHAHDERNEAGEGDMVRVVETRPLSRTKRWRLVEIVEKAR